jgi:fructokinase
MRIGVDLGGTKIEIIAIDRHAAELARKRIATPVGDYEKTLAAITTLVHDVENSLGTRASVGIGTPGATSPVTGVLKNANSTVLIGKDFQTDICAALGRDVRIANDANCFALSEATDGAAAGEQVVFAVILGTGVGGGIAVGRRILSGRNRIAGEWGHMPLPWPRDDERPGPLCYCGKHGCIETWLAGPRFAGQYREAAAATATPTQIAAAAQAGDAVAARCLEAYEDRLARGLAVVIDILDPDTVVLGGGVSNIPGLAARVAPRLARYVLAAEVQTQVVCAKHGDSSGVRGAAMLWEEDGLSRDG